MKKEAVFIHIPKTGGASIRQICKDHDIKVILHNSRDPNYVSLAQYRRQRPYVFSFSIVRNPWDRLVSGYYFLRNGGITPEDKLDADRFVNAYKNFNEFVLNAFEDDEILKQIHFKPQYLWISDKNKLIVDYLGRFESLQYSVSNFLNSIGHVPSKLAHLNKGSHKFYKDCYCKESMELVHSIYFRDIELFNYDFN